MSFNSKDYEPIRRAKLSVSGALSNLLVVAPVGAYTHRVRKGIDFAIGRAATPRNTKVKVVLVVSNAWLQDSNSAHSYSAAIEELKVSFSSESYADLFPEYQRIENRISFDSVEECIIFLLKTLGEFFREGVGDRQAYVDLTSAPIEWIFACTYAAGFFESMTFYFVRPKLRRSFNDFSENERKDEGSAVEAIPFTGPDPILRWWTMSGDYHYELFRIICMAFSKKAKATGLAPDIVDVDIEQLARDWQESGQFRDVESLFKGDAVRSIGKHLSQIERQKLFLRTQRLLKFTPRGYALAASLFPDLFERGASGR
jgi:hypothetical protein